MNKTDNVFYSSSNLTTNFKPSLMSHYKNYNSLKKNNHQKFCKNFLIYILLFKYKSKVFKRSNIFIKKYKKNLYTILRSPYRHKLARHQIYLQRYNINFSIWVKFNNKILVKNFKNTIKIILFLKKFSNIFESNLIFIKSIKFAVNIYYCNNFYYKNYLKLKNPEIIKNANKLIVNNWLINV